MLMANSVEGRFPFLDSEVMDFCNSLPGEYKLAFLDEKHILKRAAAGLIPEQIIKRKKQPYRAPDAASFLHQDAPAYIEELFSEKKLKTNGIFDPVRVRRFFEKCISKRNVIDEPGLFSNTDNMSFIGILSTQLTTCQFIDDFKVISTSGIMFKTFVDCTQNL